MTHVADSFARFEKLHQVIDLEGGISTGLKLTGLITPETSQVAITGISNANPAVVTIGSGNLSGLSNGEYVRITGVTPGCTSVNAMPTTTTLDWPVTVLSPTTFSIPTTCNASYVSGGIVEGMPEAAAANCGDGEPWRGCRRRI